MGAEDPNDTDPAVADTRAPDVGADLGSTEKAATTRAPRSVRSGDVLGRYELAEEIGEGGMATVFRARDRELRREVAVKVLFPHLARRVEIVRRFHREARAAAGLEHANILRIYDVGGGEPIGGGEIDPPYIVMELIRGRTLLEEIEQHGAMLSEIVACIGALLAEALAAAHAALIVHRDIKPSNVLIAPGGRLLLADFGVARLETETSLITRTGALLGTPAYMSPEQSTGDTATAKSDLYSLGATLYQLATGALPYSGSPAKVMSLIASGTLVSPERRRPAVGPDLSKLIERLMAIDPEARPASASVIAGELRALAVTGGLGDPTDELAAYFADPAGFVKTCTPKVVTAVVTAAERAITEARLPRAIALADRASALTPDDPAVTTLVRRVTEGGRASRRRRLAVIGLATAVLAAGGTALGMQLVGSEPEIAAVVVSDASAGDGPGDRSDGAVLWIDGAVDPLDASPLDPGLRDAAIADAGPRLRDAGPVRLA
ncbi:MAG: serine/threonine protein kinase, partial [Deltaproteobacteria bacterium]|nr:serine/threonine protein kinase [Deltaproteobacteria bacterium]